MQKCSIDTIQKLWLDWRGFGDKQGVMGISSNPRWKF